MKREKAEKKMIKLLKRINKIYKKYNPHGEYIALSVVEDVYSVNNRFWREDKKTPINAAIITCKENKKPCIMCKYRQL